MPSLPGPDSDVSTVNVFGFLASPEFTPSPVTFTFSAGENWLSGLTVGLKGDSFTALPSKKIFISYTPLLVGVYVTSVLPGERSLDDILGLLGPFTSKEILPGPASVVSTVKVVGLLSLARVTPSPYTRTRSAGLVLVVGLIVGLNGLPTTGLPS